MCACVCSASSAIMSDFFFLLFCSKSTGQFHFRFILSLTSKCPFGMVYGQSSWTRYFENRYQHELWWHQHLKLIISIIYWMGNLEKMFDCWLKLRYKMLTRESKFQIPNGDHMFYVQMYEQYIIVSNAINKD